MEANEVNTENIQQLNFKLPKYLQGKVLNRYILYQT